MSVFTPLDNTQLQQILNQYALQLVHAESAHHGIENSNFFIHSQDAAGRSYASVLTLFEQLQATQLPWFLDLLDRAKQAGLPVAPARPLHTPCGPDPRFGVFNHKPFILVPLLPGTHPTTPSIDQCHALGHLLARFHLLGEMPPSPVKEAAHMDQLMQRCLPHLPSPLAGEARLVWQRWQQDSTVARPVLIHGDLFRDNVLLCDHTITGLLDLYTACQGAGVYDLAICINDWCSDGAGDLQPAHVQALLTGYLEQRQPDHREQALLPLALQRAALRFWLSRLEGRQRDHTQAEGAISKDPAEFQRMFTKRLQLPNRLDWLNFPDTRGQ